VPVVRSRTGRASSSTSSPSGATWRAARRWGSGSSSRRSAEA